MEGDFGRIARGPFKVTGSLFFALAMLAAIGRFVARFSYQKRLFADDYILLSGCLSLIAAFTLTNVMFEDIYFVMSLIVGPLELVVKEVQAPDFRSHLLRYQQLFVSSSILYCITGLAVKFSFLLFFRQMTSRLRALMIYWTVIVAIVAILGVFWICAYFIACPKFGVSALECTSPSGFMRTDIVYQIANVTNMVTDLLIVSVPIILLWKVKIWFRQKLILACFLCLPVCMFAICLVRTVGGTISGSLGETFDFQWNVFWQLIEACVAVITVSLAAFRSLYGIKLQQDQYRRRDDIEASSSYLKRILSSHKNEHQSDEFGQPICGSEHRPELDSVDGTLVVVRAATGGKHIKSMRMPPGYNDPISVHKSEEQLPNVIKVVSDIEVQHSPRGRA